AELGTDCELDPGTGRAAGRAAGDRADRPHPTPGARVQPGGQVDPRTARRDSRSRYCAAERCRRLRRGRSASARARPEFMRFYRCQTMLMMFAAILNAV